MKKHSWTHQSHGHWTQIGHMVKARRVSWVVRPQNTNRGRVEIWGVYLPSQLERNHNELCT
jgi:hypothetical protein